MIAGEGLVLHALLDLRTVELAPPELCHEIFASIQIEAELPRVLHALAVPEFMEAWMQLPDSDRIECYADGNTFDRFRIDMIRQGMLKGYISGSCLLSKPNRVTYLWEMSHLNRSSRSMAEIRLWYQAGRCMLKLRHSGLATPDEREWHSRMWQSSLSRLCGLMEGSSAPLRVERS
jgi:uncharacterized protein YndB with AHSA1/START domain